MTTIDEEWMQFCDGTYEETVSLENETGERKPKPSQLYISTKTKISYLNSSRFT